MCLDMSNRSGDTAVSYEPFPSLPFWVEFEGVAVGDDTIQFVAIWAIRDPDEPTSARVQLLCADMQQSKELFFDLTTGNWEYEQMGQCSSKSCPVARRTREGVLYRLTEADSLTWMNHGCNCAVGGNTWSQLVNIVNHVLKHRKEPLQERITERVIPVPYQSPKTRKEKVANSEARRNSRANIVTISLSSPVRVSQDQRKAPTTTEKAEDSLTLVMEKVEVEGYYKILMPGKGKPWKRLQIIPIAGYSYERAITRREREE